MATAGEGAADGQVATGTVGNLGLAYLLTGIDFAMPDEDAAPGLESRVLVAYLPNPRDLELAERQGWYRIRSREMADRLRGGISGFGYLAFYQPKTFGHEKYCVRRYARVRAVREARRVELLPDQPHHPRAQDLYYKLELGPVRVLDRPVVSQRPRRILFIPTTWAKVQVLREINDLFIGSRIEDLLYRRLRELELTPEREWYEACADPARAGRPRRSFFMDFALFCRDRQLDIEADGDTWHTGPRVAAADNERDNLLEANRWHILRFNTSQIEREMDATLSVIREAVNRYGGVLDPNQVVRSFSSDGRLAPGQSTLDL